MAHLTLATLLWATVVYAAASLLAVPAGAGAAEGAGAPQASDTQAVDGLTTMESATNTGELAPAETPPPLAAGRAARAQVLRDYLALTKPRIISLLLITTVATMFVADPSGPALATILWTMLGGYLAAGGAGAINHYLERDRDARMARTCARPLVAGRIEPLHGLVFGVALGALATVAAGDHRQRPRRRAGARRAARLRVRLHALAQAAHASEHRHRRRRRRGAAARRLGRGDRRADPRRALPVRDRLPLDAAPLLGAGAADQGRLRPHRDPDAAGRARRAGDPAADPRLQRGAGRVHRVALPDRPVRALYLAAALVLGAGFIGLAAHLLRRPSRAAAVRLHLASLAYLALLFCAMAVDRMIA